MTEREREREKIENHIRRQFKAAVWMLVQLQDKEGEFELEGRRKRGMVEKGLEKRWHKDRKGGEKDDLVPLHKINTLLFRMEKKVERRRNFGKHSLFFAHSIPFSLSYLSPHFQSTNKEPLLDLDSIRTNLISKESEGRKKTMKGGRERNKVNIFMCE